MDDTPQKHKTLGQAIGRQWQVPLFIVSVIFFAVVVWQMRPKKVLPTFDDKLAQLREIAEQGRYRDFYAAAELLRQETVSDEELGQVHLLAAQTRCTELEQRHELGIGSNIKRGNVQNYESILEDYKQALHRNTPAPDSVEAVEVYEHMGMVHWQLHNGEKALTAMAQAIELSPTFLPRLRRTLVEMELSMRSEGYLGRCRENLQALLNAEESSLDDRAWAFLRQVELLILEGRQEEALAQLTEHGSEYRQTKYNNEMQFLRCLALRHSGEADLADIALRQLMGQLTNRGDIYARSALELGRINYEQFRYHDARRFYDLVVQSQLGKDWFVAGKLGLAECAALHERYEEASLLYEEAVNLLQDQPFNRVVDRDQVKVSLMALGHRLGMLKQFKLALPFIELESRIADKDDSDVTYRLARMYDAYAQQLQTELEKAQQAAVQVEPTLGEDLWVEQQEGKIRTYYTLAAETFLRVTQQAASSDDELYGTALQRAATSFDKAGLSEEAIEVWQKYVAEREGSAFWPFALFHLAQAYQALGNYPMAITHYETLLRKHPRSPARFDSMVPLAHSYLSLEPAEHEKAQRLLQDVLTDPALTPKSTHFRAALIELGQLHYDSREYAQAIELLNEAVKRYPDDDKLGRMMFLIADSYRASGLAVDKTLDELSKQDGSGSSQEKLMGRRRLYLENARDCFQKAIAFYEARPSGRRDRLDDLYLRHSWMYWADCIFDLGQYNAAVRAYEEVALRYQLTPTALTALVQVVNCQLALDNNEEARSTRERALWQLRKMSDEELLAARPGMTRQGWQDWFNWVGQAGLWQN